MMVDCTKEHIEELVETLREDHKAEIVAGLGDSSMTPTNKEIIDMAWAMKGAKWCILNMKKEPVVMFGVHEGSPGECHTWWLSSKKATTWDWARASVQGRRIFRKVLPEKYKSCTTICLESNPGYPDWFKAMGLSYKDNYQDGDYTFHRYVKNY